MELFDKTLGEISEANKEIMNVTRERWDGLFKTIGGLGTLEELSIKISGMTGKVSNKIDKKAVVVMCADNGIVEEGVSSCPQDFTVKLTKTTLQGNTAISVLSKFNGADVFVVDMGLLEDIDDERVINKKVSYGTKNFLKEAAMTKDELIKAIEAGIEVADKFYAQGYDILGTGELGIGNTSTSAAIFSIISDLPVEKTCGKGAGLTEEQFEKKKKIVEAAIKLHNPDRDNILEVMATVGGYDIAGMCGMYLSAAKNRKPIVVDGFISSVAALCAIKLNENTRDFMIASHLSKEPGASALMEELGLEPMLDMKMRLGEGTGCPMTFRIIETSLYTLENMGTFADWDLKSSVLVDIR